MNIIKKAMSLILCAIIAASISACGSKKLHNNSSDAEISSSGFMSSVDEYDDSRSDTYSVAFSDTSEYSESDSNNINYDFSYANVGDIISFGAYEQDNNASNGEESILWVVLDKNDSFLLLTSAYLLDRQKYDDEFIVTNSTWGSGHFASTTWETCYLRKWLNETFINKAFSAYEQSLIQSTTVKSDVFPESDATPGNDTTDKIFLLSFTEVNKYFISDETRVCAPTYYADAPQHFGLYPMPELSSGSPNTWWLRTTDGCSEYAMYVDREGSIMFYNYDGTLLVNRTSVGDELMIRPALWINTDI